MSLCVYFDLDKLGQSSRQMEVKGTPDQRKRANSENTGISPEPKKMIFHDSPDSPEDRIGTWKSGVAMPSDEAPNVEWFKACFSKMDELLGLYNSLKDSLNHHDYELKNTREEVQQLSQKLNGLEERVTALEMENLQLKTCNKQIHENNVRNEIHRRELNLVFDGIMDSYQEDYGFLHNKLVQVFNHMEVFYGCGNQVQIVRLRRLGPYFRNRDRPVLCQFLKYSDVQLILRNRGQLPHNVFVKEDFPPEIEERRRVLRPIFNKAKNMDKYKGKCRLNIDKLIIDGYTYTVAPVNNLEKLPQELNPRKSAEREDAKTVVFFTQASPFSNFCKSPFVKDGVGYSCGEQYIQAQKALIFDDDVAHRKIMRTASPFEMKKEGKRLRNYVGQVWEKEAEGVAYDACLAKFSQNHELKDALLSTQDKQIGEASLDPYWGIERSLNDATVLNCQTWSGQNILGKVLMRVRSNLK